MATRDFFDHSNPDGLNSDDRRTAAGVKTFIGENLALAPNIERAHIGLMNSAPHKANILNPDWERVGLGMAVNARGSLLVTQWFSTFPITDQDLADAKATITQHINTLRGNAGLSNMSGNTSLSNVAKTWSLEMISKNFFETVNPQGQRLLDRAKAAVSKRTYKSYIYETSKLKHVTDLIIQDGYKDGKFGTMGIGLAVTSRGLTKVTILLTD